MRSRLPHPRSAQSAQRARRTTLAALSLGTVVALTVSACSSGGPASDAAGNGDGPDVLATFTILADITSEIAGDELEVASLTRPGAEIHGYDPSPGDIRAASDADMIISNGLHLEDWIDRLTEGSDATRVVASEGVDPIMIEGTDKPNPHAWMSPNIAEEYVDNITDALVAYKPEAESTFRANADAYKSQLHELETTMRDGLAELPDNERALVTCEGAFSFLARDAGLKEGYIWAVNSDEEVTSQNLTQAEAFIKDNDVPAVFCESTVDEGPKQQLIRDTGARDGGTLYVDSLTEQDGVAPTYLDLIRYDTETIVSGLTGKE